MVLKFKEEPVTSVSSVHESARGDTGAISITSGHMWATADSFPEILQTDCSRKSNQYNYMLLSIVAMDQYGVGQPVHYSPIETNSDWHMGKSLDHIKRANAHWRFVRIIMLTRICDRLM